MVQWSKNKKRLSSWRCNPFSRIRDWLIGKIATQLWKITFNVIFWDSNRISESNLERRRLRKLKKRRNFKREELLWCQIWIRLHSQAYSQGIVLLDHLGHRDWKILWGTSKMRTLPLSFQIFQVGKAVANRILLVVQTSELEGTRTFTTTLKKQRLKSTFANRKTRNFCYIAKTKKLVTKKSSAPVQRNNCAPASNDTHPIDTAPWASSNLVKMKVSSTVKS